MPQTPSSVQSLLVAMPGAPSSGPLLLIASSLCVFGFRFQLRLRALTESTHLDHTPMDLQSSHVDVHGAGRPGLANWEVLV